jgi:hypothetical protein
VTLVLAVDTKNDKETAKKEEKKKKEEEEESVSEGVLLFSKLDTYGPAKNRDHLPDPLAFMDSIKKAVLDQQAQ